MATLEKLNQALVEKTQEITDIDQLRSSIDTIGYAMQYILAEGNRFSEKDTLSIIRALNILRGDLQTLCDLRASIDCEKMRQSRESYLKDQHQED